MIELNCYQEEYMGIAKGKMVGALTVVGWLLVAAASSAQQAGSGIAGVVRDGTGAVLPGATVEASRPALFEKVRTAFSDGQGQSRSWICRRVSIR